MATRAVVSGRRTYENAGRWNGDHHDGVPIFVLTHGVPDDPPPGNVSYMTDVRECAQAARAAARDGDVVAMGAGAAQAVLAAGELDERELHVVPVLLGHGRSAVRRAAGRGLRTRTRPLPDPGRRKPRTAGHAHALPRHALNTDRARIRLHLIPVLLGGGTPLFAGLDQAISLQRIAMVATPAATHLHFSL